MGESPSSFVSGAVTLIDVAQSIRNTAHSGSAPDPDLNEVELRVMQRLSTPELIVSNDDDLLLAATDWDLELASLARIDHGDPSPHAAPTEPRADQPGRRSFRARLSRLTILFLTALFIGVLGGSLTSLNVVQAHLEQPALGSVPSVPAETNEAAVGTRIRPQVTHNTTASDTYPPQITLPAQGEPEGPPLRGEECGVEGGMTCITVPVVPLPDVESLLP